MFKLLQKTIGIKQLSVLAKIDVNEINDICYSDKFGFFFTSNQCIGLVDKSSQVIYPILGKEGEAGEKVGFSDYSLLDNPTSICFKETTGEILVLEKWGRTIRSINTKDNYNNAWYIPDTIQKDVDKRIAKKIIGGNTSLCFNNNMFAWTNSKFNMVFVVNGGLRMIGNGKDGYAISNNDSGYMFNGVSGLMVNDNKLYISDTNNHCIRSLSINSDKGIGHHIETGHPLKSEILPKKILVMNNNFIFVNEKSVKGYNKGTKSDYDMYTSDSIVSITNGPQNRLTILEKENA